MSSPPPPEELRGSLAHTSIADVLQFLRAGKRTGELHASSDNRDVEAIIWLRDGELFHAALGEVTGIDALATLISWQDGVFWFKTGESSPAVTITDPIHIVLMKAAHRLDEMRKAASDPRHRCVELLDSFISTSDALTAVLLDPDGSPQMSAGRESETDLEGLGRALSTIKQGVGTLGETLESRPLGEFLIQFEKYEVMCSLTNAFCLVVVAPGEARLGVVRHRTKQLAGELASLFDGADP